MHICEYTHCFYAGSNFQSPYGWMARISLWQISASWRRTTFSHPPALWVEGVNKPMANKRNWCCTVFQPPPALWVEGANKPMANKRSWRCTVFQPPPALNKPSVWAAFFYLTFELQVYMLFVSSGAKHCQSSSISVVSGIGYVSLTLYNLFM